MLVLLERLAADSGHPELRGLPLLFWGHSAAGPFGTTFALRHPERTIAFVRYHSGLGGIPGDLDVLEQVPALFLQAEADVASNRALFVQLEAEWRRGRSAGAPWTFGIEPGAVHQNPDDVKKANALLIPWITAVLRARLSADGRTVRTISDESAWLGSIQTGETTRYATFPGPKHEATWLPDEQTARGWSKVVGAAQ